MSKYPAFTYAIFNEPLKHLFKIYANMEKREKGVKKRKMYEEIKKSSSSIMRNSKNISKSTAKSNKAIVIQLANRQNIGNSTMQSPIIQRSSTGPSSPDELGLESRQEAEPDIFHLCVEQLHLENNNLPRREYNRLASRLLFYCHPYFLRRHIIQRTFREATKISIFTLGEILAEASRHGKIRLVAYGECEIGIVYRSYAIYWNNNINSRVMHLENASDQNKSLWRDHVRQGGV